jgi:hypothetical protein
MTTTSTNTRMPITERFKILDKKGFTSIPLRADKKPLFPFSADRGGWTREDARKQNWAHPGITDVAVLLVGDALVFDVDAKQTHDDGTTSLDKAEHVRIRGLLPAELKTCGSMESTRHGTHYWFKDHPDFPSTMVKAVVDEAGAKLGLDILKRQRTGTGRIVKVHSDKALYGLPSLSELAPVPESVLGWFSNCRSDRFSGKAKAVRHQKPALYQPSTSLAPKSHAVEQFERCLWELNPARCHDGNDWWKLKSYAQSLGAGAKPVFREWSRTSVKFRETDYTNWATNVGAKPGLSKRAFERMLHKDAPAVWKRECQSQTSHAKAIADLLRQPTDTGTANLAYEMMGDEIIAVQGTGHSVTFWTFDGVRWVAEPNGQTLSLALSTTVMEEVQRYFLRETMLVTASAGVVTELENVPADQRTETQEKDLAEAKGSSERFDKMANNLTKVKHNLCSATAKRGFRSEYADRSMAEHKNFVERLDSKTNLIAFENGVYELDTSTFRASRPDDWVTRSTGYNYRPPTAEETEELNTKFLKRVFRDDDVRHDLMLSLASGADGEVLRQKFQIWTNGGANGKSALVKLLTENFGFTTEA